MGIEERAALAASDTRWPSSSGHGIYVDSMSDSRDLWKPTGVNQAHGVNGNANIKLNGHILLGAGKTPVH